MKRGPSRLLAVVAICVLAFGQADGQTLHLGVLGGGSLYQGELKDGFFSVQGMRIAKGLGIHYAPNDKYSIAFDFVDAMLGGNDAYNNWYFARRRNLRFDTKLREWAVQGRVNLVVKDEATLLPYLKAGLALFHVDPYSFASSGRQVYLYTISTEGQGLVGTGNQVPSRLNLSLPFGGGVELRLTKRLRLDVEVGVRKTFTDYIDDVSGTYPDEAMLLSQRGPIAVELAYRGDELPGGDPVFPQAGTPRGNPKTKDWYHLFLLRLRYPIFDRSDKADRVNHIFKGHQWPYRQ